MALTPNTRLGAYEIVAPLGEGGMGEVYRARDTRLGREVALKVLPANLTHDPERRQRFEREARAAAGVNHPHIVTLYAVEEAEGVLFLTMELVEGTSLRPLLPQGGFAIEKLLDLVVPLADAVHAAHGQGIIHRDLKPENIMVTSTGWVKVLDFGLAKLGEKDPADSGKTQAATLLTTDGPKGTVAYMSPEQAEGKPVDPRTDIFSLGVLLYEMATGVRPFRGDSTASTLSAILRDAPRPVGEVRRDLPPHLNHVIQRCLAKDPERRYQTALELRNELEALRETLRSASSSASGRLPRGSGGRPAPPEPKRIVVLPFENLGAPDDAYFAAGITEEITSRLAAVSGLAVASRTTAVQYDRAGKTLRLVGADLRVEFVLEGTVRWARKGETSRVRVTPQLIRVSDDSHIWADRYDRDLDDIFDVQSEIAKSVVENLGVTLLEPERGAVTARPTQNMDAYQAYLRGLDYAGRMDYSPENFESAARMFQRAVDLDPAFALAHARLAYYHAQMHFFGFDRHPDRLARAKASADRALELAPDLPEAHQALGKYYYAGPRDYAKAIDEYEITRRGYPNRADILVDLSAAYRRRSEFEKSLDLFAQAETLEPTSPAPSFERGVSFLLMRRTQESEAAFARVISLAPDQGMAYAMSAMNRCHGSGDLAGGRKFLEASVVDSKSMFAGGEPVWIELLLMERKYRALLEWIDRHLPSVFESQFYILTANQLRGLAHALLGDADSARPAYRAAADFLQAESEKRPDDPRLRSTLGLCYAGLGEKAEAVREGEEAVRLLPVERDSMVGAALEEQFARILTQVGEHDAAIDRIEHLLSIPSWLTVHTLRLDPRWDPLREHPRFRGLANG